MIRIKGVVGTCITNLIYLFNKDHLFSYLQNKRLQIKEGIRNEKDDYILNVGKERYISY